MLDSLARIIIFLFVSLPFLLGIVGLYLIIVDKLKPQQREGHLTERRHSIDTTSPTYNAKPVGYRPKYMEHPLYKAIDSLAEVGRNKSTSTNIPYRQSLQFAKNYGSYKQTDKFLRFKIEIDGTFYIASIFRIDFNKTGLLVEDEESYYGLVEKELKKFYTDMNMSDSQIEHFLRNSRDL